MIQPGKIISTFRNTYSLFFPHERIKYITSIAVLWARSFLLVFITKVKILPFQSFMYGFPTHKLYWQWPVELSFLHYSSASERFQKAFRISSGITSNTTEGTTVLTLLLQRVQHHLNTMLLISVVAKPGKICFMLQRFRGTMGKKS